MLVSLGEGSLGRHLKALAAPISWVFKIEPGSLENQHPCWISRSACCPLKQKSCWRTSVYCLPLAGQPKAGDAGHLEEGEAQEAAAEPEAWTFPSDFNRGGLGAWFSSVLKLRPLYYLGEALAKTYCHFSWKPRAEWFLQSCPKLRKGEVGTSPRRLLFQEPEVRFPN